jgi:hypothetical protein
MITLTHLLDGAAVEASVTGVVYAGVVSIAALTAIAAPTANRRRDARNVLKLLLRGRAED